MPFSSYHHADADADDADDADDDAICLEGTLGPDSPPPLVFFNRNPLSLLVNFISFFSVNSASIHKSRNVLALY